MGVTCHGICDRIAKKPQFRSDMYSEYRYCSICSVYLKTKKMRCVCCNVLLRRKTIDKNKRIRKERKNDSK
jgi:hypothetical protein